jgi:hypothetical protein
LGRNYLETKEVDQRCIFTLVLKVLKMRRVITSCIVFVLVVGNLDINPVSKRSLTFIELLGD